MTNGGPATAGRAGHGFRHEALFYSGQTEFVERTASFIREGLEADEPTLVVVTGGKIDLLRSELGSEAAAVHFADMAELGRNPGRIISAWHEFVRQHGADARRVRGVGEPIWAERTDDELVECQRHESLLNLAFVDSPPLWLVCPYDTESLDPAVVEEARRTHPFIFEEGAHRDSPVYYGLEQVAQPFTHPLPDAPETAEEIPVEAHLLNVIRGVVSARASAFGISGERASDLVVAVNEVATNTLRHGGGRGRMRVWEDGDTLVFEVTDEGRIHYPLTGRRRPAGDQVGGLGLWLVNQLCDLVQIRSFPTGSVVRLHMSRDGRPA